MSGFRFELAALLLCALLLQGSAGPPEAKVSRMTTIPVLNRVTFDGNVHDEKLFVEHWMVLFCVEWYEPCQKLRQSYVDLANDHERKLNADALLQLPVRFAEVDCTVDKVLCNEQLVDWYPEIVHYHRSEKIARWELGQGKLEEEEERMTNFLEAQLNFSASASDEESGFGLINGNKTEDIFDLPLAQQHPVKTAIRLAPLAAALVGMAFWVFTTGAEVLDTLRRLRAGGSSLRASRADAKSLRPASASADAGASAEPSGGLRHRLPESWARERRSIEL